MIEYSILYLQCNNNYNRCNGSFLDKEFKDIILKEKYEMLLNRAGRYYDTVW